MTFYGTILGLAMGGRSSNTNAMSSEETTNGALEKFSVKITTEALGPTASVNKEAPECILNGCAGEIWEAVTPSIAGCEVNKNQTVAVSTGTRAVAISNVGTHHPRCGAYWWGKATWTQQQRKVSQSKLLQADMRGVDLVVG
jgi:hypothetical protein